MKRNIIIKDYKPSLNLIDTEITIKLVKDTFERKLAQRLGLIRVSAPLFVEPTTGLNDNLTGFEKAVSFKSIELNQELEVVQSLAKWKRNALKMYDLLSIQYSETSVDMIGKPQNIYSASLVGDAT